jgi:DNA recombination protein RmuC
MSLAAILWILAALQLVTLIVLALLLARRQPASDSRLAETLPLQLTRLDDYLREAFAQLRREVPEEASRTRKENEAAAAALRSEVVGGITLLGKTLKEELARFDQNSTAAANRLRDDVEQRMRSIAQSFAELRNETTTRQTALQDSLNHKLVELIQSNTQHQVDLRRTVEGRLDKLNADNTARLEEMRVTVDEKLHATLQTRLTESFGQVTEQLTKVHEGLGEMSKVSTGMDSLSRVFSNVKARGTIGEVLLGTLLDQMLAPSQFVRNAQVKPNTRERVEFAVRFPGAEGDVLLPIDSNFPRESWDRLQTAYETGIDIPKAVQALESAIRAKAKDICELYINEPVTTPNAILFVPSEGLYAEIMRRDGLAGELQQKFHVSIAGPNNLAAILTCFQMVFQLINLQKKGGEVWKVLAAAKTEFGKFEKLMDTMGNQVGTVQNTIENLGKRTRAIQKTLRDVGETDGEPDNLLSFDSVAPLLAASGDEA